MITILAVLIALAAGWCCGHRTARIRIVVIGATPAQDQAALDEQILTEWRTQLEQHLDHFDIPDDPRNAT